MTRTFEYGWPVNRVGWLALAGLWACSASVDTPVDAGVLDLDAGMPNGDSDIPDMGLPDMLPDAGPMDLGFYGPNDCDPINPDLCAMPWPTNRFLEPDDSSPRGALFFVFSNALPSNRMDQLIETQNLGFHDGYSPSTPIHVFLERFDTSGLPDEDDLEASLAEDARFMLFRIDEQGELTRLAYWIEAESVDANTRVTLRPARWLEPGGRYAVVARRLRTNDGLPVPPPPAFVALRDGATEGTGLARRQPSFNEVLALLQGEGLDPGEFVVAWDFLVADADILSARLRSMVETTLATPVRFTTTSTVYDGGGLDVRLEGTFRCPDFLGPGVVQDRPFRVLVSGPEEVPQPTGELDVPFRIFLPGETIRASTSTTGAPIVQLGLPPFSELPLADLDGLDPSLLAFTRSGPYVVAASPWPGLDPPSAPVWSEAASNAGLYRVPAEQLLQAVVQQVQFSRVLTRILGEIPWVDSHEADVSRIDLLAFGLTAGPASAVAALSPEVGRTVLVRPQLDIPLSATRTRRLNRDLADLSTAYGGSAPAQLALAAAQLFFDEAHPQAFLDELRTRDLLVTLVQGDHEATHLEGERWARSLQAPALTPFADRPLQRLDGAPAPYQGSAVVLFDLGVDLPAPGPNVPDGQDPGPDLFDSPAHRALLRNFFDNGGRVDCEGPCAGP